MSIFDSVVKTVDHIFLGLANGNLELALASYIYDNIDGPLDDCETSYVEIVDPGTNQAPASTIVPELTRLRSTKKANTRFATIYTLNSGASSDENEEGQEFYVGDSELSGQQVLGLKEQDIATDMLKIIKGYGNEIYPDADGASGLRAFQGKGYRLR